MPKNDSELTEELMQDLQGILLSWIEGDRDWWPIPPDVYVDIRDAVLRDFSLAGVRARGLTPTELRQIGRRGGRPRRGETAEEARIRRGLVPDAGVVDYDDDIAAGQ